MNELDATSTAEMLPNIETKRRSKLLSGEEIINSKNNSLKDLPSGCKEYAPDNSWLEQKQIQATLETYHNLVGAERIEKKQNLSAAIWMSDVGKAKVTKKAGKHWEVFGHTISSEDWLFPEEALFLLEVNALELFLDDVPLSLEQTYSIIVGQHCSLSEYRVFSHLSRKGYRVLRHDKRITVTRYERNVHLDQMSLAERRNNTTRDNAEGKKKTQDETVVENTPEEANGIKVAAEVAESTAASALSDSDDVNSKNLKTHETSTATRGSIDSDLERANGRQKKSASKEMSPDVMIIEDPVIEVITIDQDDENDDIEITYVKPRSLVETVNLLESDEEDDDVIFVPDKSKSNDPSKWRNWYLTIQEFVNKEFPPDQETNQPPKMTKLRMIDCFDLANKSIDSIMRAIPPHNGSVEFINAPDQRFIPAEILPKFSHYRISLNLDNAVQVVEEENDEEASVDTTQNLDYILRNDQSRTTYGYSFHRTRSSYNRRPHQRPFVSWMRRRCFSNNNENASNEQFFGNTSFADQRPFFQHAGRFNQRASGQNSSSFQNQNNFGRSAHTSYQNNGGSSSRIPLLPTPFSQNSSMIRNHQPNHQYQHQLSLMNNVQSTMGQMFNQAVSSLNPTNPAANQMKMALQQACQMQLLAMSLMQGSQTLMQFGNTTTGGNNFNQFTGGAVQYRSRRPYYRGNWRGRGLDWRRQAPFDSQCSPKRTSSVIVEDDQDVVKIESDDEDTKVKPGLKRVIALSAIAGLNSPKRVKMNNENVKMEKTCKSSSLNGRQAKSRKPSVPVDMKCEPANQILTRVKDFICEDDKNINSLTVSDDVSCSGSDDCQVVSTATPAISLPPLQPSIVEGNDASCSSILSDTVEIVQPTPSNQGSQKPLEVLDKIHIEDESQLSVQVDSSTPEIINDHDGMDVSPDLTMGSQENDENQLEKSHLETSNDCEKSPKPAGNVSEIARPIQDEQCLPLGEDSSEDSEKTPGEDHVFVEEPLPDSWNALKKVGLTDSTKSFRTILNYDEQGVTVKEVLKSLQVIGPINETDDTSFNSLKVAYDVYLPHQPFRKSLQLVPNYRIIVAEANVFPSVGELNQLKSIYLDDVSFVFAVVFEDSVGFYNLQAVELPLLIEEI